MRSPLVSFGTSLYCSLVIEYIDIYWIGIYWIGTIGAGQQLEQLPLSALGDIDFKRPDQAE